MMPVANGFNGQAEEKLHRRVRKEGREKQKTTKKKTGRRFPQITAYKLKN